MSNNLDTDILLRTTYNFVLSCHSNPKDYAKWWLDNYKETGINPVTKTNSMFNSELSIFIAMMKRQHMYLLYILDDHYEKYLRLHPNATITNNSYNEIIKDSMETILNPQNFKYIYGFFVFRYIVGL